MTIKSQLRNLQDYSRLALSLKVSIYTPGGAVVYSETQVANLAAGHNSWLNNSWTATEAKNPGYYAVWQEVWQPVGDYQLKCAGATVTEVSSYDAYLPLLVAK